MKETGKPTKEAIKPIKGKIPKKKPVIIIFLLSIITLGIYCTLWFVKRSPELNNLKTKTKSHRRLSIFFLILHLLFVGSVIGLYIDANIEEVDLSSPNLTEVPLTFTILFFTALTLGIIETIIFIYLSFNTRKILNEALSNKGVKRKVSAFFTFFLNYYYLQYEINRIIDNKEKNKRLGPWIFFILIYIISPIISGATQVK